MPVVTKYSIYVLMHFYLYITIAFGWSFSLA